MFINHHDIEQLLEKAKTATDLEIQQVLDKVAKGKQPTFEDIAILLQIEKESHEHKLYDLAGKIKQSIYGKRVVMFAPLYVSNYCVNSCVYCGYNRCNAFERRKLTQEEVAEEVRVLEKMGHKRLALELGEDPVNCPIEYVEECLKTIYKTQQDHGEIRRVNVNIAATTVENYKKLKQAHIGTYILFQETYHQPTYEKMHPQSLKGDYAYHLTAFDRAMEAGVDDVGAGALFGLYDYQFEVMGLLLHNQHLQDTYGVGFHTVSVPRLKKAEGMSIEDFPYLLDDKAFKKIIAILRIAMPFTGIILSTRETAKLRREALRLGVSQVSAGSVTGVGGYKEKEEGRNVDQFETSDNRSALEVLKSLLEDGYIPSYCTACYRKGRTGEKFMEAAQSGKIQNLCEPNAMMTLMEFALDYGDEALCQAVNELLNQEVEKIENETIRQLLKTNLEKIKQGERDLYL